MTHKTEAELVYYGTKEATSGAFEKLVKDHLEIEGVLIKDKTTKKLKIYKDTQSWDLRRMGFCHREQAYQQVLDTETGAIEYKRITKLSDIGNGAFWQGTTKSDGVVCEMQGVIRMEEKTLMISRQTQISDIYDTRLRNLFSHVTDPEALQRLASTKEIRKVASFPVDPQHPHELAEVAWVKTVLRNGHDYRLFRLEVENKNNSCHPERFAAFTKVFDRNVRLHRTDSSMADIVYSVHAAHAWQRDVLDGRFVDIRTIPGAQVKKGDEYKLLAKGAEIIVLQPLKLQAVA